MTIFKIYSNCCVFDGKFKKHFLLIFYVLQFEIVNPDRKILDLMHQIFSSTIKYFLMNKGQLQYLIYPICLILLFIKSFKLIFSFVCIKINHPMMEIIINNQINISISKQK